MVIWTEGQWHEAIELMRGMQDNGELISNHLRYVVCHYGDFSGFSSNTVLLEC